MCRTRPCEHGVVVDQEMVSSVSYNQGRSCCLNSLLLAQHPIARFFRLMLLHLVSLAALIHLLGTRAKPRNASALHPCIHCVMLCRRDWLILLPMS